MQEAALTRQLDDARSQLAKLASASEEAETLRQRLQELEAASATASGIEADSGEEQRLRIISLQDSVARLEKELAQTTAEHDRLRVELEELRDQSRKSAEDKDRELAHLQEQLDQSRRDAVGAQGDAAAALQEARGALRDRDAEVAKLEAATRSLEQRLATKESEAQKLAETQAATIASLQRQADSVKAELSTVIAAREAALADALEQGNGARLERDVALKSVEEAERRVKDVEELLALQQQQHEATEQQTLREKDAALAAMQAELDHARADAKAKVDKAEQLQRAVDQFERLEAQRQKYERNQRAGTDLLKSRLADLQARTSHASLPLARSDSVTSSSSALSASTAATSSGEQHVELQIRNAELSSRVLELEKQVELADSRMSRAEAEHSSAVDLQRRQLEDAEARAEDWRQVSRNLRCAGGNRLLTRPCALSRNTSLSNVCWNNSWPRSRTPRTRTSAPLLTRRRLTPHLLARPSPLGGHPSSRRSNLRLDPRWPPLHRPTPVLARAAAASPRAGSKRTARRRCRTRLTSATASGKRAARRSRATSPS